MKTGNLILVFLLSNWFGNGRAQDYLINFAGSGAATVVSSVKVENLTRGTSLTMSGSDVLHLVNSITGIEPASQDESRQITFSPNPMTEYSTMQFYLSEAGKTIIGLYDVSGREIIHTQNYLTAGRHTYRLDCFAKGIFFVKIMSDKYSLSGSLVSLGSAKGKGKIIYENAVSEKDMKDTFLAKGISAEVMMQFNAGDRLKLTGISGNYSTVLMVVPSEVTTLTFDFMSCTDGDNNNYPVVKMGNQVWMGENLKTIKYNDKTDIPLVTDNTAWGNLTTPAYCWYGNDADTYKATYGAIYNWYIVDAASSGGKNVCPVGWHVPADAEWASLTTLLGGEAVAGGKLKETGTTHWLSPNTGSTNETGFTAITGGFRSGTGSFSDIGKRSPWWSATDGGSGNAWLRYVYYSSRNVGRDNFVKDDGFSVRCLKDKDNPLAPAGEWVINTGFGKLIFTVDASGTTITKMDYQFSSFTCGPVTLNGGLTITPVPAWPITYGCFLITNKFDVNGNQIMNVSGTYDASSNKFSGIWSFNSYGTICSGTWEAAAP